jgi:hypothetical protein
MILYRELTVRPEPRLRNSRHISQVLPNDRVQHGRHDHLTHQRSAPAPSAKIVVTDATPPRRPGLTLIFSLFVAVVGYA